MTQITFFVSGEPKGQPRPRAFARKFGGVTHARVYDPGTAEGWKSQVAIAARPHLPTAPLRGPLSVSLRFHFPRPKAHLRANGDLKDSAPNYHTSKPDCDNTAKAVLDALTHLGVWQDDKQVCELVVIKQYFTAPGCSITIQQLETA
jgi:Holliday junction resolvase RusA-like endonuclease